MRIDAHVPWIAVLLLVTAPNAAGQEPDLTGTWDLQAEASLGTRPGTRTGPDKGFEPEFCTFEGAAEINQTNGQISGIANLTRVSGSTNCPDEVSMADLTGQVVNGEVQMGTMTAGTEGGTFSGGRRQVLMRGTAGPAGLAGNFSVTTGPFVGAAGTWNATRGGASVLEIPTLGAVGLAALALLLLGAGVAFLRSR